MSWIWEQNVYNKVVSAEQMLDDPSYRGGCLRQNGKGSAHEELEERAADSDSSPNYRIKAWQIATDLPLKRDIDISRIPQGTFGHIDDEAERPSRFPSINPPRYHDSEEGGKVLHGYLAGQLRNDWTSKEIWYLLGEDRRVRASVCDVAYGNNTIMWEMLHARLRDGVQEYVDANLKESPVPKWKREALERTVAHVRRELEIHGRGFRQRRLERWLEELGVFVE